mgnify:CR=1 FL=1
MLEPMINNFDDGGNESLRGGGASKLSLVCQTEPNDELMDHDLAPGFDFDD